MDEQHTTEVPEVADEQAGDVLVGELQKNVKQRVKVRLTEYQGVPLVDIRVFVEDSTPGRFTKPTGKGIALRRELLPALKDLVAQAVREAAKETVEHGA